MLPGFRPRARLPKLALGSCGGTTTWVAHLHEPVLLAKIDFDNELMVLRLAHGFAFDPTSHVHLDVIDAMKKFVREEALEGTKIQRAIASEYTTPPEFLVLAHGGNEVESEQDRWLGVMRTCLPRFITEINGEAVLPLDPCEDLGPYLQAAKQFFKASPEASDD